MGRRDLPCGSNGSKVCLSYPCVPMVLEHGGGLGAILVLAESPFIDNPRVTSIIEKRGCDPRLQNTRFNDHAESYSKRYPIPPRAANRRG